MKVPTALVITSAFSLLLSALPSVADTLTLAYFDRNASLSSFVKPAIEMQAERFLLPAPAAIRRITIIVGGHSDTGCGRLRLFGHEGGAGVPVTEVDLIEPITFRKSRRGVERIAIDLQKPVPVGDNQFFVAIDHLDPSVDVLTDRRERRPDCEDRGDLFYRQLIKFADGRWEFEQYSFAIEVVVELARTTPRYAMRSLGESIRRADSGQPNRSMAWFDVDADGYLDLLWDGRLYHNKNGIVFEDISSSSGLFGRPIATAGRRSTTTTTPGGFASRGTSCSSLQGRWPTRSTTT